MTTEQRYLAEVKKCISGILEIAEIQQPEIEQQEKILTMVLWETKYNN